MKPRDRVLGLFWGRMTGWGSLALVNAVLFSGAGYLSRKSSILWRDWADVVSPVLPLGVVARSA